MAATKCNISFDIDYASSKPIIKGVASYKIKNSSSTVSYTDYTIPLPTVPYTGNSLSVSLPDIQAQGDYDLVVALTDSDNFVATQSGSFKIGNCSGNTPPKVSIKWRDNLGTEDRVCTSTCNEHIIYVVSSDADNDIVKREVLLSLDNGNTWTIYNPDLSTNTIFGTGTLSTAGKRLFKVVVTDSVGNTAISNTLSYTMEEDETSICKYLSNFSNARLDITSLPNSNGWVVATVDVNASAIGKAMNLSFEVYYRRCNDGFNNIVQVLGTDNESLKDFKVDNSVPDGDTGHYSDSLVYTPTKAGQIKLRISKYSGFFSTGDSPAYLHIDSQLLFLDSGKDVCGSLSAEHNFSIYNGSDCDRS